MPDPRPVEPRRGDAAADLGSLVELGFEAPPQVPAPADDLFLQPDWPPDDAA